MIRFIFMFPLLMIGPIHLDNTIKYHNCIIEDSIEDTWLSEEIQNACEIYGNQYHVCPELLMAIIETESNGDPEASNGGCEGLMQVSVKWHAKRMSQLGIQNIHDINENILLGTDYLYELFEKYEDVSVVLAIYHGEKDIFSEEISSYVSKILTRSEELERIHEKKEKEIWIKGKK